MSSDLTDIESELSTFSTRHHLSVQNIFVLALISKEKNETTQAVQLLTHVLSTFPLFWSAWIELAKILMNLEKKSRLGELSM